MKTEMTADQDQMPKEVAIALLTSNQKMTASFRRTCLRATERVCEPVSRSTRLNISAPATPMQRFERKLRKANAKQLTTWARRATRRGERLQDLLFENQQELTTCAEGDVSGLNALIAALEQRIGQIDAIGQAINLELTSRASRGKVLHV